jgi:hypothetical protein
VPSDALPAILLVRAIGLFGPNAERERRSHIYRALSLLPRRRGGLCQDRQMADDQGSPPIAGVHRTAGAAVIRASHLFVGVLGQTLGHRSVSLARVSIIASRG